MTDPFWRDEQMRARARILDIFAAYRTRDADDYLTGPVPPGTVPGCTCNAPYSRDWRAHPQGCPARETLRMAGSAEPDFPPPAAGGTDGSLFRAEPDLTAYGTDGLVTAADGSKILVRLAAPSAWVIAGGPCRCEVPFASDPASHAGTCPRRAGPPAVFASPVLAVRDSPATVPGGSDGVAILSGSSGTHLPGCGCGSCAAGQAAAPGEADWTAEFRAVLGEPLGLPGGELPGYDGPAPDGACGTCHRGPLYQNRQCLYCWTLGELRASQGLSRIPRWQGVTDSSMRKQRPVRYACGCGSVLCRCLSRTAGLQGSGQRAVRQTALTLLGTTLVILSGYGHPALALVGAACFAIVWRSMRRHR